MHCRSCGEAMLPAGLYCVGCGDDTLSKKEFLQLEAKSFPYCKGCGTQNEKGSLHCVSCGNSLMQYQKKSNSPLLQKAAGSLETTAQKIKIDAPSFKKLDARAVMQTVQPKYILTFFGVAFALLFIVFAILSAIAKNKIYDAMQELKDAPFFIADLFDAIPNLANKLAGIPFLFLQSIGSSFYVYSKDEMNGLEYFAPFLGLSLLIAIVFYFAGKGVSWKANSSSLVSKLINSIAIGVLFAIAAAILSIFTKENVHTNAGELSYGMATASSMWKAFLLGTLFSLIGGASQQTGSGDRLLSTITKSAWRVHFLFIVGLYIATLVILSNLSPHDTGNYYYAYLLVLMQWVMVPFGSFTFNMQDNVFGTGSSMHEKISMGTFTKVEEGSKDYYNQNNLQQLFGELSSVHTLLVVSIILLVGIAAFLGYRQALRLQLEAQLAAVKLSLAFGAVFTFIMAGWMQLLQISLSGIKNTETSNVLLMAPDMWKNIFLTFIVISISHYAGAYWRLHQKGIKW